MANKTGSDIIDEVRAIVGRDGTSTMGVISDARVALWLNEGIATVAEECPGLQCLDFKCTTNLEFSSGTIKYLLTDVTWADNTNNGIIDVYNVWYLDGASSIKMNYLPIDEFDSVLIDPTNSDVADGQPDRWTRRGNYLEIAPRCSTADEGKFVRVDGMRYPRDFTVNATGEYTRVCEMPNVDKGLTYYAVGKAWEAIGDEVKGQVNILKFSNPISPLGGWLEHYKERYSAMPGWDNNLYPKIF